MSWNDWHPSNVEMERRLTSAFRSLGKQHYVARQRYACCRSCAWAEADYVLKGMSAEKRSAYRGHVYTTEQGYQTPGRCMIYYGQGCAEGEEYGLPTVEIGQAAAEALRKAGLIVNWNGDPEIGIDVTLASEQEAAQ